MRGRLRRLPDIYELLEAVDRTRAGEQELVAA
jgi:hypothetical protein